MNKPKMVEPSRSRVGEDSLDIQYVPNADVISLETMVNMMVKKGICTAEELFMLEGRVQELGQKNNNNKYVSIHNHNHFDRGRFPAFKRAMSQHWLGRRLGTLLFGWKWKKIKKDQSLQ